MLLGTLNRPHATRAKYRQPLSVACHPHMIRRHLIHSSSMRGGEPKSHAMLQKVILMSKKLLIDARQADETRVVLLNENVIEDVDYEISHRKQLKGNIYLAKVTRVEPSLQAAFVEYGGNRQGFLAFSEIHPDYYRIPVEDREKLLAEPAEMAEATETDHDSTITEDDSDSDADAETSSASDENTADPDADHSDTDNSSDFDVDDDEENASAVLTSFASITAFRKSFPAGKSFWCRWSRKNVAIRARR